MMARRASFINIDDWLDRCTDDGEPDSMIYDPDYSTEVGKSKSKQIEPSVFDLYKDVSEMCSKIGMSNERIEERLADIDNCITAYLQIVKRDVEDEYNKLCEYKQQLIESIQKMLTDLYLPAYEADPNVTMLQSCRLLKAKFKELDKVKQKRMDQMKELRDKQVKHCLILGIETPALKFKTDIPTEQELIQLNTAVADLEKEERKRRERYNVLKSMIEKCMDQLEYETQTEFEQKLLKDEPAFTESHLKAMSNFHGKLEALYSSQQEKLKKATQRLISLYNRLDVPQFERDQFLLKHDICKPSLMLEMEAEIEKYEILKKQNIGIFIEKIKKELFIEYERCYVVDEQQDNIFSLSSVPGENDGNDQLLELYERELERIKNYYEENSEILEKFQKWQTMWKELIDLELKANDPNRFNNRGGQLLLEERKRKTLQKGLPKIEKELLALNDKYSETHNGNKFKVYNDNMDDFITGCWNELNAAKEEEKRERQRAKMTENLFSAKGRKPVQTQVVIPRKSPAKRVAGAGVTPTPTKMQCRSIISTPSTSTSRMNYGGLSNSVKKPIERSLFQSHQNANANTNNHLNSGGPLKAKSNIPRADLNLQTKVKTNSNGSDFSALSLDEDEFELQISSCTASAKRMR